jgi:hypothetical protein
MLEFLSLLFKYTFKQPAPEGFYACLDIWNVFLDYIGVKVNSRFRRTMLTNNITY